ncbi:hypothetical protein SAMN05444342_1191 [Haladaptatus paucihalophilus DX253]|uniref:Uncharacterized protein n=2 Tax=Haladaptatus paucihalophilus DX253 TaxID=797209 RepID=A0A1M6R6P7_HALPU|nr:hypothetical protein HAL_33980 [Haladaptatus sp. T7]SHK28159.1 hypothetical protein SAMN05444342_1191 [Haladaptatus paucihalophilus DX253]
MGVTLTLMDFWEGVRWLGETVPFFTVLPAFIGILVLVWMFAPELSTRRPTPTHPDGEYRFDPDDFEPR